MMIAKLYQSTPFYKRYIAENGYWFSIRPQSSGEKSYSYKTGKDSYWVRISPEDVKNLLDNVKFEQ